MRLSTDNQRRIVLGLIGLTTIAAGFFTWRAGQLASSAAFQDRQSVGQTIKQAQQGIVVGLGAVTDTTSYVRYIADYAEAGALDDRSAELDEQGAASFATLTGEEADALRAVASARAAAAGVFGRLALYADLTNPNAEPRPFDFNEHLKVLATEAESGIRSPGRLDPDYWATEADATRSRVSWLRVTALVLIVVVLMFTIAQIAESQRLRIGTAAVGLAILVGVAVLALTTVF